MSVQNLRIIYIMLIQLFAVLAAGYNAYISYLCGTHWASKIPFEFATGKFLQIPILNFRYLHSVPLEVMHEILCANLFLLILYVCLFYRQISNQIYYFKYFVFEITFGIQKSIHWFFWQMVKVNKSFKLFETRVFKLK